MTRGIRNAIEAAEERKKQERAEKIAQGEANVQRDMAKGKEYADELLGEDFALSRLGDDEDVQNRLGQLEENASLSDQERLARQESAYGSLASSEKTQQRNLLRGLSAAGVKGGAAAGALGDMATQQAQGRRQMAQDLYLQEQQMERQGLRDLVNYEMGVKQYDIGQEQAELSTRLQTQLQGASLYSQERSAIRQQEAALAAANAQKSGGGGGLFGTVLCTAMYHHNFISEKEWKADVEAGKNLLRNDYSRASFIAYNKICKPLAKRAIDNKTVARILAPFIVPISKSFSDGNLLGRINFFIMLHTFKAISLLDEVFNAKR